MNKNYFLLFTVLVTYVFGFNNLNTDLNINKLKKLNEKNFKKFLKPGVNIDTILNKLKEIELEIYKQKLLIQQQMKKTTEKSIESYQQDIEKMTIIKQYEILKREHNFKKAKIKFYLSKIRNLLNRTSNITNFLYNELKIIKENNINSKYTIGNKTYVILNKTNLISQLNMLDLLNVLKYKIYEIVNDINTFNKSSNLKDPYFYEQVYSLLVDIENKINTMNGEITTILTAKNNLYNDFNNKTNLITCQIGKVCYYNYGLKIYNNDLIIKRIK